MQYHVKLKICGITSLEDALISVDCGAEYLGFNFFPASPRFIAPDVVREITDQLPPGIITAGIFVNEARPEDVTAILEKAGVKMAQLHGDESPEYCEKVGAWRVIKALRVNPDFDAGDVLKFPAEAVLLDAFDKKLFGGTGKTLDWEIAAKASRLTRLFLAGGLSPENIAQAIEQVRPFAVDVNSGVEISPGRKDPEKLRKLKEVLEKF
jgi:phosphoribosylanthranilate isomerase